MADDPHPHADDSRPPAHRPSRRGRPAAGGLMASAVVARAGRGRRADRLRHHSRPGSARMPHLSMDERDAPRRGPRGWIAGAAAAGSSDRRRCRSARSAGTRQIMQHPRRRQHAARRRSWRRRSARPATATRGCQPDRTFPSLAGQTSYAIYKQLHDYRTGARAHPQMTAVAKALAVDRPRQHRRILCRGVEGICGASARAICSGEIEIERLALGRRQPAPDPGLHELPHQRRRRADRDAGASSARTANICSPS